METFHETVNFQDIIDRYKSYGITLDEAKVQKAMEIAVKYHGAQQRASGDPYYYHPLEVAEIVAEMKLDTDSIITAILHDTIEDTDLTLGDIERHFGKEIAKLVDGVTKLTKIKFKVENVRQAENFRKFLIAISDDIRVLLVKLADRLHNMRTIDFISSPEKRKRIALETLEIYAPLAERIGVQQLKIELQDICFRVLNPEIRQSILNRFESIATRQDDQLINRVAAELTNTLEKGGLKAEVLGRKKTPYSTWMKMKQKNVNIDQLSDIVAFRIIVDSTTDCYKALGIIHTTYKMVPESFQDFISTPKNNGYQSLHTVIIGPSQQKVEVQIRTQKMHDIAELGIAAHWRYKQNRNIEDDSSDVIKYTWIRELLSILEQNSNPEEFLQNTKMAMYYDQVFCFTPNGSLVALPKGATPVDFAYMVHSNLGNSCVGAKVNGKVVPLKTQLSNGDQVEIVTSKNQTASPSWEKFVVTGKARGEIRKATQTQKRGQYIKLGHAIISKALKSVGVKDEKKALESACSFFNKNLDELYFSVGEGSITREEVLKQSLLKKSRLGTTLSMLKFGSSVDQAEYAIPIKGLIPGMVMHFASCCCPLPGDRIVGILHSGNGVMVHTSDCEMLNNFSSMPEKILDLTWDSDRANIPFVSRIKILLLNEVGSLAALSGEIAKSAGNIINFQIISRNTDYFEMVFDIEVKSSEHLDKIISTLRTQDVVQYVDRDKGSNIKSHHSYSF